MPSEAGSPVFVQHQTDSRWVFPQHAAQVLSAERFPFPPARPFILCNEQAFLLSWEPGLASLSQHPLVLAEARGQVPLQHGLCWPTALPKHKVGKLKHPEPPRTVSAARLPVPRLLWHGWEDDLFCGVYGGEDVQGKDPGVVFQVQILVQLAQYFEMLILQWIRHVLIRG